MSIYSKLANIQKYLKCNKAQFNSYGKYHYRSCEDILEAVKPLCIANNCVLTLSDDIVAIGDRFYVKAIATIIDMETNEQLNNVAFAREENEKKGMDASQITGTASSYARKYCLHGLFCIDDTKDADTNEFHEQTHRDQPSKAPAPKKVEPTTKSVQGFASPVCNSCGCEITDKVAEYSKSKFGKALCFKCQKNVQ